VSQVSIPSNVGEVTAKWLEAALLEGGNTVGSIASIELVQIGAGIGVMGELYRATITYASGSGPESVIVKLPSQAHANREQGVALGMYDAEVRFYNELASKTQARLPKTLARLHASWWGKVDTAELAWVPSVVHERIQTFAQMWPMLWEMYVPKFEAALPEGAIEFGSWLSVNYWTLVEEFATSPWTLLHLDYRVDNIMFDSDLNSPDGVTVIDWQSVGRGPAGYDLAYLLGGSVTVEDRRAHEIEWLHEYHDEITRLGVVYSFDDLWKDYCRAHVIGGTSTATLTGATFDLGNERGLALITSMAERHYAAPLDLDARSYFTQK
jgi:hypothetical protein